MPFFSILCILWPLFVLLTTSQCADFIIESGRKTVIACAFLKFELNTTWQVRGGDDFISVTSCAFGQNICVDHMPHQYIGEVVEIADGFISLLTINKVRVNETEFRCLSRYSFVSNTLEVYARPSNPVCNPVELDYTKKNLQFRCRATNVFPSVSAILYIRGVDSLKEGVLSTHCAIEETGFLTMDGYSAECIWRIFAAKLEPIKYGYYVVMFPNLSNSTGIDIPNAFSQDYTLKLKSPVAVIDYSHCPVGSVMDGRIIHVSSAKCKCVLESPGFPSGQARWYRYNSNQSLGKDDTTDGSSTLVIDTNIPAQSYKCAAESPLNNSHYWGPVYTPVFTRATTPSSSSLRIELVAGIVAGSVLLTVIITALLWKWRSRKRQSADTTSVVYKRSNVDAASDSDYLKVYEDYEKVF